MGSDLYERVRYLPSAIERTHRKLTRLIQEAETLGLKDLADESWDDVIREAQLRARLDGGSVGFGDGK